MIPTVVFCCDFMLTSGMLLGNMASKWLVDVNLWAEMNYFFLDLPGVGLGSASQTTPVGAVRSDVVGRLFSGSP